MPFKYSQGYLQTVKPTSPVFFYAIFLYQFDQLDTITQLCPFHCFRIRISSGVLFWPWKKWCSLRASAFYPSRNNHSSMPIFLIVFVTACWLYNFDMCILQEAIPGCKGLWTVYHKNSRNPAEHSKTAAEDDEHHAYLIISLESRTMVICLHAFSPLLFF